MTAATKTFNLKTIKKDQELVELDIRVVTLYPPDGSFEIVNVPFIGNRSVLVDKSFSLPMNTVVDFFDYRDTNLMDITQYIYQSSSEIGSIEYDKVVGSYSSGPDVLFGSGDMNQIPISSTMTILYIDIKWEPELW